MSKAAPTLNSSNRPVGFAGRKARLEISSSPFSRTVRAKIFRSLILFAGPRFGVKPSSRQRPEHLQGGEQSGGGRRLRYIPIPHSTYRMIGPLQLKFLRHKGIRVWGWEFGVWVEGSLVYRLFGKRQKRPGFEKKSGFHRWKRDIHAFGKIY